MANSLSNLNKVVQESFLVGLAESTAEYARCGKVWTGDGATKQLMGVNAGGIATEITGATSSVTPADMTAGLSSITQRMFVLHHKLPQQHADLLDSDTLANVGTQLANAAAQNINKLFFDGLEGLFALAHPMAGAGAGQVGAGKKFIDTGLAFLQGEAGAGTQANLLTAALSESSLDAAKQLLRGYKNQRGLPMNMSAGNRNVLVVSPANEKIAQQLIRSGVTSDQMQINTFQGFADICVFPLTTDADDWWLIDTMYSPVGIWVGMAPQITVTPSDDQVFWLFTAKFNAAFAVQSHEDGIVGSNVP